MSFAKPYKGDAYRVRVHNINENTNEQMHFENYFLAFVFDTLNIF